MTHEVFFRAKVLVSFVEPIPGKSIEVYQLAVLGGPSTPVVATRVAKEGYNTCYFGHRVWCCCCFIIIPNVGLVCFTQCRIPPCCDDRRNRGTTS
jgi:hypothetical protein